MSDLWFFPLALLAVVPFMYAVVRDGVEQTWRRRVEAFEGLGRAAGVAAESLRQFSATLVQFSRAIDKIQLSSKEASNE